MSASLDHSKFSVVGLVHKLCLAWLKAEGLPADMNTLAEDPLVLKDVIAIIRGEHTGYVYKIDCDANPRIPWEPGAIMSHRKMGTLTWSKTLVALINVAEEFGRAQLKSGLSLKTMVESTENSEIHANACILDFLERHPGLRPKEWNKYDRIFFLNTKYRLHNYRGEGRITTEVRTLERSGYPGNLQSNKENVDDYYFREKDAIAVLSVK